MSSGEVRRITAVTIVLDPGHGGSIEAAGSTPNNVTSPSGMPEKTLTLALAKRIAGWIADDAGRAHAARLGKRVKVILTRSEDLNPSFAERSAVAARSGARLFLSLHFNRGGGMERGTEAWIDRKCSEPHQVVRAGTIHVVEEGPGRPSSPFRNLNHVDDAEFATAMATLAHEVIRGVDRNARLRSTFYSQLDHGEDYRPPPGVKMIALEVLRDTALGLPGNPCRACLLQFDFLDHPSVDELFNGPNGPAFQDTLARAMALRLIELA